jgi:nitrogen regulatory protein PII
MRTILAVIQPFKLDAVLAALHEIEVTRITVCDSQGYGRQRGQAALYRGHEYKTQLLRKVTLEIIVNEDFLERTINIIEQAARTGPYGNLGDGKIMLLPCYEAIQISDGLRGPGAV